ncbi:hypothetical protein [Corynebacterium comes]|uniref:Or membrane protein n=1 Tax=Corynebacterium comes TaxID=2675218 RepID=A0A6B8W088_9CORY|nr:hypothetical protein [Corynebacterium comes]QGU04735.1 hypothetical protein CETAM_07370 [Corynebacterium comes]
MKLLSRKALAAVATTVALTTAGISAPAFAAEQVTISAQAAQDSEEDGSTENEGSSFLGSSETSGDNDEEGLSSDPKEIRDWVAVFTAIVGALSTAFVFMQRLTTP